MKRIARTAIVAHSAEQVYALVEDIDSYPRFLPWCAEARILERNGRVKARITAALRGLRQTFTTSNDNRPGESIDMHLVEGPFRRFDAAWRFTRLSATACRIEFTLEYEFTSRVLAVLLDPLFDRIADTMVDAFARRADAVYGTDG
ncbi:MAG: type II toxin-antitoxin system RatA family toxin [Clostridia bacterium]